MATLVREFTLDVPVEKVWNDLSEVGAINRLIDYLGVVTVEGDTRTCALENGGHLEELIVTVDEERKRIVYSIKDSPFGFEHHNASMQAVPEDHGTRFVWTTDLTPDSLAPALQQPLDAAVASIKRHFA
jgi:carbon monoxide dehydrogenase subunit G